MNIADFWQNVAVNGYTTNTTPIAAQTNIADFWKVVAANGVLPTTTTPFAAHGNIADFWQAVAQAGVHTSDPCVVELPAYFGSRLLLSYNYDQSKENVIGRESNTLSQAFCSGSLVQLYDALVKDL